MSKYVIQDTTLQGIANAIRSKTGKTDKIPVENLATEINDISSGAKLQEKTATANGEITPDAEYDGLSKVTVNVPIPDGYIKPSGKLGIVVNGTFDVTDKASVDVNVPIPSGYIKPSGTKTITENGTHNIKEFENVTVNVPTSGGTGGECSGNHIIEVDTLPTENISETDIYKCGESYYKYAKELKDAIIVADGEVVSFIEAYSAQIQGINFKFYSVDNYENVENPNIFMDESTYSISMYFDTSRNDIFVYDDEWFSLGEYMEGTNGGAITDVSEATTEGYYYALVKNGYKVYANPYVIEVDELPTENIDTDAIYCVKTTECVDATIPFGSSGAYIKWEAYCKGYGLSYNVFNVDALPTENIGETIDSVSSYLYYVTSENKIYTYQGGVWTTKWLNEDVTPVMGVTVSYYKYGSNRFEVLSSSATKDVEANAQIKRENSWGDGSRYLEYILSDDGTYYTLEGCPQCPLKNWVIASNINGIPVTEMQTVSGYGGSYFDLDTLVIPDTIQILALSGLYNVTSVNVMVIGKGVTAIWSSSRGPTAKIIYYKGTQEEWEAIEGRNNLSYTNIIYGS